MSILNDYAVKINLIAPTALTSTSYIFNLGIVVKQLDGEDPSLQLITNESQIAVYTESLLPALILNAGLNKFWLVLASTDEELDSIITTETSKQFFTIINTESDYLNKPDSFKGVWIAQSSTDSTLDNLPVNLYNHPFFSMQEETSIWATAKQVQTPLSNYLQYADNGAWGGVEDLGRAEVLFDKKFSFVIADPEKGNRLGYFGNTLGSIKEPYIIESLEVAIQDFLLNYIQTQTPNLSTGQIAVAISGLEDIFEQYVENQLILGYRFKATTMANFDIANFSLKDVDITYNPPVPWWRTTINVTRSQTTI